MHSNQSATRSGHQSQIIVDPVLHAAHPILWRQDLDAEKWGLRDDMLVELRPNNHADVRHAISCSRDLESLLLNRKNVPQRAAPVQIEKDLPLPLL